jgi:hypothetical protein
MHLLIHNVVLVKIYGVFSRNGEYTMAIVIHTTIFYFRFFNIRGFTLRGSVKLDTRKNQHKRKENQASTHHEF